MLARPADRITLAEVILALEGPLEPVTCIQEGMVDDCPFHEHCVVQPVWRQITEATRTILENTNFADLAQMETEQSQV